MSSHVKPQCRSVIFLTCSFFHLLCLLINSKTFPKPESFVSASRHHSGSIRGQTQVQDPSSVTWARHRKEVAGLIVKLKSIQQPKVKQYHKGFCSVLLQIKNRNKINVIYNLYFTIQHPKRNKQTQCWLSLCSNILCKLKTLFYKRDPGASLPGLGCMCVLKEAYKWSWYLSFYLHDSDICLAPPPFHLYLESR